MMNIKDAQKCFDLVLNEQACLAGQYPDGDYYNEFAVICKKYDIDPRETLGKCFRCNE